jgi:hypothetical protein
MELVTIQVMVVLVVVVVVVVIGFKIAKFKKVT